jgi:Helical and beta-bridge domain
MRKRRVIKGSSWPIRSCRLISLQKQFQGISVKLSISLGSCGGFWSTSRYVRLIQTRMRVLHVVAETPVSFLQHLKEVTYIERKPLRFCAERLALLIKTLEINDLTDYGIYL